MVILPVYGIHMVKGKSLLSYAKKNYGKVYITVGPHVVSRVTRGPQQSPLVLVANYGDEGKATLLGPRGWNASKRDQQITFIHVFHTTVIPCNLPFLLYLWHFMAYTAPYSYKFKTTLATSCLLEWTQRIQKPTMFHVVVFKSFSCVITGAGSITLGSKQNAASTCVTVTSVLYVIGLAFTYDMQYPWPVRVRY